VSVRKKALPPPESGTNRFKVQQLHNATDPKFASFARTEAGQSARFNALHETLESAIEVARMHAAQRVAGGSLDFTYYIVEIKYRVGIEHGRPVDEPMA